MAEKKSVIFTRWQLVAHTVNLKSEDHTWGHVLKSSHILKNKNDSMTSVFLNRFKNYSDFVKSETF